MIPDAPAIRPFVVAARAPLVPSPAVLDIVARSIHQRREPELVSALGVQVAGGTEDT